MKRINYFWILFTLFFAASCESPPEWHDKVEKVTPGNVTLVDVKNINGGAILYFTYPNENKLLGAKATYTLTNGEVLSRFASVGTDSIKLEGFGDTQNYTVMLYTVHESGNLSEGVPVPIKPLTPFIDFIRNTAEIVPTFGGVKVTWNNPELIGIGVSLFVIEPDKEEWVLFDNYYSDGMIGKYAFKKFDPEPQKFKLEFFDRWNNYAEPIEKEITPLREEQIISYIPPTHIWKEHDKEFFSWYGNIFNETYASRTFEKAIEGRAPHNDPGNMWNPGGDGASLQNYIGIPATMPFPLYVTIDMGRKAIYTSLNILSRQRSPSYSAVLPIHFEIWGTNNPKTREEIGDKTANLQYWTEWLPVEGKDTWKNDWTRIATCRLILSSGTGRYTAGMQLSSDDLYKYTTAGFDFEIDEDTENAYRYLRWVIYENNQDAKQLQIVDIKFWGVYVDD